jgi:hypothetical protein
MGTGVLCVCVTQRVFWRRADNYRNSRDCTGHRCERKRFPPAPSALLLTGSLSQTDERFHPTYRVLVVQFAFHVPTPTGRITERFYCCLNSPPLCLKPPPPCLNPPPLCLIPQIFGTDIVGNFSIAFTVASLGPFILIILLGGSNIDVYDIVQVRLPPFPLFQHFFNHFSHLSTV